VLKKRLHEALTHPVSDEPQMVQRVHHPTLGELKVLGPAITVTSCTPAADEPEGWLRYHPPLMGEQSVEILREAGYAPERIDELVASDVVAGRVGSDVD
jgi:crotonobetainyl-CoA:carnitine CoA-transferase CaiB-like acyl-CoA transferase